MSFKKNPTSVSLRTFSSFVSGVEMFRNDEWYATRSILVPQRWAISCGMPSGKPLLWQQQLRFIPHQTTTTTLSRKMAGCETINCSCIIHPQSPTSMLESVRALNLNLSLLALYKVEIHNDNDVLLLKLFSRRWKIYHRYCTSSVPLKPHVTVILYVKKKKIMCWFQKFYYCCLRAPGTESHSLAQGLMTMQHTPALLHIAHS